MKVSLLIVASITFDPNYSRLIVMATGKPLRKGAGFASDTWLFFPSVSYGVTNNITMMAGMSIFPFISIREQLYYRLSESRRPIFPQAGAVCWYPVYKGSHGDT